MKLTLDLFEKAKLNGFSLAKLNNTKELLELEIPSNSTIIVKNLDLYHDLITLIKNTKNVFKIKSIRYTDYFNDFIGETFFNKKGLITFVKNDKNTYNKYKYDKNDNLIEITSNFNYNEIYEYDNNNNLIFKSINGKIWEIYEYDKNNKLILFINSNNYCNINIYYNHFEIKQINDNLTETIYYDKENNIVCSVKSNGFVKLYIQKKDGIKTIDLDSDYEYKIINLYDSNNKLIKYSYYKLYNCYYEKEFYYENDKLISIKDTDGFWENYEYENDKLIKKTNSYGDIVEYKYQNENDITVIYTLFNNGYSEIKKYNNKNELIYFEMPGYVNKYLSNSKKIKEIDFEK